LGSTKSKKVAVEAGVGMGWEKWTGPDGLIIAMKSFGASAPAEKLFQEFGFSVEKIYQKIKNHLS
jgi:transketolase